MQQLIKKSQDKKYRFYFKILLFLYLPLMLFITLMPVDLLADKSESWLSSLQFKNEDKVAHFILFFIFTLLLFFSQLFSQKKWLWLLPISVGIGIELLQNAMNLGRSFDVLDIVANTLGTFAAYAIVTKFFLK